ncbi:MAG: hypothetical protein M5U26_28885 [Planctomycetota bacterium]|nr:hypothetical protein [Planctomycetota bacterium]
MRYAGEVVFLRIFDLGGTVDLAKAREALGALADAGAVASARGAPEYVSFALPLPLNLASLNLAPGEYAGRPVAASARLYEVGGLALMLRVPVRADNLKDFARASEFRPALDGRDAAIREWFERLAERLRPTLKDAIDEVFQVPIEPERYTVYCLTEAPLEAAELLVRERAQVAGLLLSEPDAHRLAPGTLDDTLRQRFSYYAGDLAVADWDAAFLLEPSGQYEDLLYVFEAANLQLLVLRKYDKYLDDVLERSYVEFERLARRPRLFARKAWRMSRELAEVRMDLAKATDELANLSKFFGEWYLARVYLGAAGKLHCADFQQSVASKVATLNELYANLLQEIDVRRSLLLEIAIVLLIVLEILMALFGKL